jgi:hypothetical protein
MAQTPIEINAAKKELRRIDQHLTGTVLLIGGLAVQQYETVRATKDIDLVCDYDTARELIRELYPNEAWDVIDENDDEHRPKFTIRHKFERDRSTINFGPKITQRPHYPFLSWEMLGRDARPFTWQREPFQHISVPCSEMLCLSKIGSFLGRDATLSAKIRQDLVDACALSNHRDFRLGHFYNAVREAGIDAYLRLNFWTRAAPHADIFKTSYLYRIAELFGVTAISPAATTASLAVASPVVDIVDLSRPQVARNQEKHFELYESSAKSVSAFCLNTICGLLQHVDYATVIMALYHGAEPRAGAHARIRRQELIRRSDIKLRAILHETIWKRPLPVVQAIDDDGNLIRPNAALIDNLRGILALIRDHQTACEIAVLPEESRSAAPLQSDYMLYDDALVSMEGLALSFAIRDTAHVRLYRRHFEESWNAALKGAEATDYIRRAIELQADNVR